MKQFGKGRDPQPLERLADSRTCMMRCEAASNAREMTRPAAVLQGLLRRIPQLRSRLMIYKSCGQNCEPANRLFLSLTRFTRHLKGQFTAPTARGGLKRLISPSMAPLT